MPGSVGSTGQIELAHQALDQAGVPPGPLAVRVITAAGIIDRLREQQDKERTT